MTRATHHEPEDAALRRLRMEAAVGGRVAAGPSLPTHARTAVALADRVGAPIMPVLDAVAEAAAQRRQIARQVATAAAPARAVAGMLVALPLVVVPMLGRLVGADLVGFYRTGPGLVVGAIGASLWVLGTLTVLLMLTGVDRDPRPSGPAARTLAVGAIVLVLWGPVAAAVAAGVAWLTHRAPSRPPHPNLDQACDLTATGLSAGVTVPAALRLAAEHVPDLAAALCQLAWRIELGRPDVADVADVDRLADLLVTGLDAGGPLVPGLRALAREVRAERGAHLEGQALRLPARLTFPTSLLLLPATVLLIGAPIVASGLDVLGGA